MTIQELADQLIDSVEGHRLYAICGNGLEYFINELEPILLYGLVKVKVTYGPGYKSIIGTPDEMRSVLRLVKQRQLAKQPAALSNIAPPVEMRVASSGPKRLRSKAQLFPYVSDLATYGRRRLLELSNVGTYTVQDAEKYCQRHGLKLAD